MKSGMFFFLIMGQWWREYDRGKLWILHLVLMPLKLELATELRLERPLSLAEVGEVCDGESRPRSSLTAESGLSGSGSELFMLTLALFLAALFRKERREFSICERHTKLSQMNMHEVKTL